MIQNELPAFQGAKNHEAGGLEHPSMNLPPDFEFSPPTWRPFCQYHPGTIISYSSQKIHDRTKSHSIVVICIYLYKNICAGRLVLIVLAFTRRS